MYHKLDYQKMWKELEEELNSYIERNENNEDMKRDVRKVTDIRNFMCEIEKQELEAMQKEHAERNGPKLVKNNTP